VEASFVGSVWISVVELCPLHVQYANGEAPPITEIRFDKFDQKLLKAYLL
jgi:hypothetical protein